MERRSRYKKSVSYMPTVRGLSLHRVHDDDDDEATLRKESSTSSFLRLLLRPSRVSILTQGTGFSFLTHLPGTRRLRISLIVTMHVEWINLDFILFFQFYNLPTHTQTHSSAELKLFPSSNCSMFSPQNVCSSSTPHFQLSRQIPNKYLYF